MEGYFQVVCLTLHAGQLILSVNGLIFRVARLGNMGTALASQWACCNFLRSSKKLFDILEVIAFRKLLEIPVPFVESRKWIRSIKDLIICTHAGIPQGFWMSRGVGEGGAGGAVAPPLLGQLSPDPP